MSARKTVVRFFLHAAMVVGGIFVVTVLLAAMPGHNAPSVQAVTPPEGPSSVDPGQKRDAAGDQENEQAAVSAMNHMHGGSPHLRMTEMRAADQADASRAKQIVDQLRAGIEKYKDYHAAL